MKAALEWERVYNIQMNNNEFHNDTANTHYALIWLFKFSWSQKQKQKRPSYRQPDFTNDRAFCDNFLNWNETAIVLLYLHQKKKYSRQRNADKQMPRIISAKNEFHVAPEWFGFNLYRNQSGTKSFG